MTTENPEKKPLTVAEVREVLTTVYDPELQLNIVDLGLVYDVRVNGEAVQVDMTLTSPGCPYGPELVAQVRDTLLAVRGVTKADVKVVWVPPWSLDKMSEAARLEMGLDV
jgi:metal-sulfur cluster biosynthetic enzyme